MRFRLPSAAPKLSAVGIAVVALALAAALLWLRFGPTSTPTASAGATTKIAVGNFWFCNSSFQDGTCVTQIDEGDTVQWNFTGSKHTSSSPGNWVSPSQYGGTYSRVFNDPGVFDYFCFFHPDPMRGTIIVGDPPTATPVPPSPTPPTPSPTPTSTPTATPTPTPEPGATFGAKLTGAQVESPTGSAGSGSGTVVLNTTDDSALVTIDWSGLGSAAISWHIHCPAPRKVGAPIVFEPSSAVPETDLKWMLSAQDVADLNGGLCYFNVHSTGFPSGEIRGQIVPQSIGGIAELPEVAGTPLETPDSSGSNTGLIASVAGAVLAGGVTIGGAAWYARRRWG